ncbi:MAG: MmgE/PrpD family protein [Rhodospirillaceae bacterium]|nr:MmgE/PrpD family protein [Rhodospirillaceae bacterium]MBT4671026.1 MmgE/PrpD family protein [Rhodospirillaceae bacterium]MBT5838285.1 MmgE/PrpD family protein [Rhodospirillaceae bacterium]MBT6291168.1 MmgE/PrpD family protein [Rhodospirillaceae bacterium]MBT6858175.1 MmgE/PrpD family protein [Rhodospirillaceae bacterium]
MDDITTTIANYATGFDIDSLAPETLATIIDHIVDGMGCAIAGYAEQPAAIARSMAAETAGAEVGASVFGAAAFSAPDHAAFANAVMMRCLDFNDTFNALTGGHPSDMIAGILTAAEISRADGRKFIGGVHVAYEVFGALAAVIPLRNLGIDQGVFLAIATAAGMGHTMGLDQATTANAISLGVTTTVPLRASRAGALSAWKGCATPHSVMNAVFVTRLAMRGMEAPPNPFSGEQGLFERLGAPFEMGHLGATVDSRSVIERTAIKFLPVEWCAQAPVELFLELRKRIDWRDIEAIDVFGYEFLYNEIGGGRNDGPEKWDPKTRETADHSLAYILAVTLVDGEISLESFDLERVEDPALRPLMQKISVSVDPATLELESPRQPVRFEICLKNGDIIEEACEYPFGHPMNPAGSAMVSEKFMALAERTVDADAAVDLLSILRELADDSDLGQLTNAMRKLPVH